MLTNARIRDEVRPAQPDWISALRAPQIKTLVEDGALQLSLFDEQDLLEIDSPEFPGERLVRSTTPPSPRSGPANARSCLPPPKKNSPPSRPPPAEPPGRCGGKDKIALRVGKVFNHYKMAKRCIERYHQDS